jgi:hypothetical protein
MRSRLKRSQFAAVIYCQIDAEFSKLIARESVNEANRTFLRQPFRVIDCAAGHIDYVCAVRK